MSTREVFPVGSPSPNSCCMPTATREAVHPEVAPPSPSELSPCCASSVQNVPANAHFGSKSGMKRLEGGAFLMGTASSQAWPGDGEGPVREVTLAPFYLDICAVSNAQFAAFVEATNYVTEAETFGWSYVFHKHLTAKAKASVRGNAAGTRWWVGVEGAMWQRPEGPGSNLHKRGDHPVVHVSWRDAVSYCEWVGKRLPSEAEWEYAARGGLEQKLYPWGDELVPRGKGSQPQHRCNIWQGKFPDLDTGADGFHNTAPARSFAPNGFGLYQMSGNVWEWCADWFNSVHPDGPRQNPTGPSDGQTKVIKGGSFLCHASYCNRYRVAARTANTPDSASSHCGFRCAMGIDA